MARKRDYYTVLGLSRSATETEVKRAFRELARKYHPDVAASPDDGERFREINEAYACLSNKDDRARYDRWGHVDADAPSGIGAVVDAATELFGELLRKRRTKQRGADIRYTLEITFEEAAFGCEKTVALPGRDRVVVINAGTKDGTVKTIKGEGEKGKGSGGDGDLLVSIRIADHVLKREGATLDVRAKQDITFAQAALGAVLDVQTLDGVVKMRIPPGTQPGRVFRIRGKGIPQGSGKTAPRGDHLIEVNLVVPTDLTSRQREIIEELGNLSASERGGEGGRPRRLIDRVRSLLDE